MDRRNSIGIAMSGGGHRATIFALGALLYLVDCGRHKDITTISSVSGGSLTNAFLALLPRYCDGKSFREVDSEAFDQAAAILSNQIAGNPFWWWTSLWSYLLILSTWAAMTYLEFPNSLSWMWQIPFPMTIILWAFFVGPKSGGTFWAVWTTWLYLGLTIFTLALGIALCFITWIAGSVLIATALLAFSARSRISQCAMGKVFSLLELRCVCSPETMEERKPAEMKTEPMNLGTLEPPTASNCKRKASPNGLTEDTSLLRSISKSPRHVFCATDLHTGRHVYFSQDLVFSPDSGLGEPRTIPLSKVIQSSANFPVAFPPLRVPLREFGFQLGAPGGDPYRKYLVLADGGIRDNTGVSWFLGAENRRTILSKRFGSNAPVYSDLGARTACRIRKQIEAMQEFPDDLIVINSSTPFFLKEPGNMWFPIWGEVKFLFKLPSLMYNNEGARQSRELRERFFSSDQELGLRGALVSIDEDPLFIAQYLSESEKSKPVQNLNRRRKYSLLNKEYYEKVQEALTKLTDVSSYIDNVRNNLEYFEYPDRNRVTASLRQAATRVKEWFKYGGDYKNSRDKLQAKIDQMRQEYHDIEDRAQSVKEERQDGSVLDRALQEHLKLVKWRIEDLEQDLSKYDYKISNEQSKGFWTYVKYQREKKYKSSQTVPTTFRPLGCHTTARLLWHGYLIMMVNASVLLDYQLPESVPKLSDFKRLAAGKSRFSN